MDLRHQGRSLMDATIEADAMRLRPAIMTSRAFVLDVLPLAGAMGVGASSRHAIGTGMNGGSLGRPGHAAGPHPCDHSHCCRGNRRSHRGHPHATLIDDTARPARTQ